MKFDTLADKKLLDTTIQALEKNGIHVLVAASGKDAKEKVLEALPSDAEVMTATSVTLTQIGLEKEINDSGKYNSVKKKLIQMDRKTQNNEMQKLGAAPEWVIGSVHAVTEDGKIVVVANTGSQIPAYSYGAQHVIWVIGTQKIVKDLAMADKRIYEYCLPLESKRAQKAYGVERSYVNKQFILHKEPSPDRITVIFVQEVLGF